LIKSKGHTVPELNQLDTVTFSVPTVDDGKEIWQLIKDTGVLDLNSSYSYLLWAKYFSKSSVVVKSQEKVVGFISGFIEPDHPDTLFIWQVAVDRSMRGKGLATKMLKEILSRQTCRNIRYLEATVTPTNVASTAMFEGLARDLKTECKITEGFKPEDFPGGGHEGENLFKIGPFMSLNL
jgi:L-2,4-diaminobutyric acid acetyltransferase